MNVRFCSHLNAKPDIVNIKPELWRVSCPMCGLGTSPQGLPREEAQKQFEDLKRRFKRDAAV